MSMLDSDWAARRQDAGPATAPRVEDGEEPVPVARVVRRA
jgi:hypothetical protein